MLQSICLYVLSHITSTLFFLEHRLHISCGLHAGFLFISLASIQVIFKTHDLICMQKTGDFFLLCSFSHLYQFFGSFLQCILTSFTSPLTPPQSTPFPTHPTWSPVFFFLIHRVQFVLPVYTWTCSLHQHTVKPPVSAPLQETGIPFSRSHPLPMAPELEMGCHALLPSACWDLAWPVHAIKTAGVDRCICHVQKMPFPRNYLPPLLLSTSLLPRQFLSHGRRERGTVVSFRAEHSNLCPYPLSLNQLWLSV